MFNGYHFMLSGLSIHTRKELKKAIRPWKLCLQRNSIFEKDMKECEKTPNEGEVPGMAAFVVLSLWSHRVPKGKILVLLSCWRTCRTLFMDLRVPF